MKDALVELPSAWKAALASGDTQALLRLRGYHLTAESPLVAPMFEDLARELRFSDLSDDARAWFVRGALAALDESGPIAARDYCVSATTQLEDEYVGRHERAASIGGRHD